MENEEIIKSFSNNLEVSFLLLEAAYKSDQLVPMLRIDYYVKAGKYDRAEERLVQLIDENPDNYYACEKLLLLYSERGDNEKLFKRGAEFAEKFNRSFLVKILYASGATGVGEFKIAMAELSKARILAGNQKEFLMQVYAMEADIYYKEGDFRKAFSTYEEALKLDPNDIMILNNYAYFLSEKGMELQKALQMSKQVIENERTSTYLDTYAWILYKQGKSREALKIMNEVINMDNSDAELWEHLGFIQKDLRKCADAVVSWEKALEIDSSKNYLKEEIEKCAGGR
jgi:Tfp pilus assembly protein PilF